jgi:Fe-S-cluster containining protein
MRDELLALYKEADALLSGWECGCTHAREPPRCCQFAVTGREPYPTAVELEEVRHGMRTANATPRDPRKLPLVTRHAHGPDLAAREPDGSCPLLAPEGRCRIYASRPFGCRTFFCQTAEGPEGPRSRIPRDAVAFIGRRIADLSARFAPHDPHPRPLTRALASTQSGRDRRPPASR